MPWTIGPAEAADSARIKQSLAECGGPTEDLVGVWHESFLVARDGEAVVGAIGLETHGEAALVRSLAVAPAHRARGIASTLLEKLEARAAALSIGSIYGLTVTAEAFFMKRGYERIDRTEMPEAIRNTTEFRELCPETAACMWKARV